MNVKQEMKSLRNAHVSIMERSNKFMKISIEIDRRYQVLELKYDS